MYDIIIIDNWLKVAMTDFKRKILKEIGIIVALVSVMVLVLIYIGNNIKQIESKVVIKRNEFYSRSLALANLAELKSNEALATKYLSLLRNALPTKIGLLVFQDEMKQLARSHGLSVELKFIGEEEGGEGASKARFSLNLAGEYNQMLIFLKDLEASRYFIKLDGFELSSQGGNVSSYQAKINGAVFFK